MEIPDENLKSEITHLEDLICTAEIYRGTREGETHMKDALVEKGCLKRLGIVSDDDIHKMWNRAKGKAERTGRNYCKEA